MTGDLIKLELTEDQATFFRFCMDNHVRIEYFRKKKLFDFKNGSITVNFKPTEEIQNVQYHYTDNEL